MRSVAKVSTREDNFLNMLFLMVKMFTLGKFACGYCESYKLSNGHWAQNCPLRAFRSIIENYEHWKQVTDEDKKKVKDFKNCSGIPLVLPKETKEDTYIIDYMALPALHLILGAFNKLWDNLLEVAPEINSVAQDLGTVREDYFGNNFEGNEVNKLLENTSKLRDVVDENLHIFIDCMDSLQAMKLSCFGYSLGPGWRKAIQRFKDDWTQLVIEYDVATPNKVHIIFDHLATFIDRQKSPLGEFSEQVVEAAHQKLDKISQWYIVKMVESEKHGKKFLDCINHFNSMNI